MFIEVLVISVIIGLLRGGRFSELGRLRIRYIYLIFLAYLIQVGIDFAAPRAVFWGYPYLHAGSYMLLFFALIRNRFIPGFNFILGGTALNFAVIALNGGRMPVRADVIPVKLASALAAGQSGTHGLMLDETRLKFLADIFHISLPYQSQLISIGDIVINAGVLVLVLTGMKRSGRE